MTGSSGSRTSASGGVRLLVLGELLIGVSAVGGGTALLTATIDPGAELLAGSVFDDYTWPGLVLLVIVGGSSVMAAISTACHGRHAALLTLLAGVLMSHWIVVEWAVIGFHWLQAVYLLLGVSMAIVGWRLRAEGTKLP